MPRRSLTTCLALLWALLALAAGGPAWAAPLVVDRDTVAVNLAPQADYLEDADGRLRIADVRARPPGDFRPLPAAGDANFGYSAAAYWLRFTLAPAADAAHEWLLEVAFPSLDRVEFYRPAAPMLLAGDHVPFAARPLANRNFLFPLRLEGDAPQTFYLRVASEGTLTVPLRLWRADAFAGHSQDAYAALSLYYGMLLALMLYNLLLYLSIRDRNYLTYVAFVAAMAVGQLSLNGLGNQYVWPEWPAWGNIALPCGFAATGFFGALFTRGFLETARTTPRLDFFLLAYVLLFGIAVFSPALLPYRYAAMLVSLLGASFPFLAVAAGVACLRKGQPGAPYFLIAWTLLLIGVSVMGLRNFDWLPTNFLTTYAMQLGSALEMLLLSFALADRINVLRREKEAAQGDALAAKQHLVESLLRTERELEQRVAERTYELEQANLRLREGERVLKDMAHHDPLTGLANRLLLDAHLEHAVERAKRSGEALAVLLVDLDGFKPINDSYGHAIGDVLLREIGRRLSAAVRKADTVARLGGDEFVVVLEAVREAEDATRLADKIIADLSLPAMAGGKLLAVGASVGIAFYAGQEVTPAELLRRADTAMYAAKNAGRGRYQVFPVDLSD